MQAQRSPARLAKASLRARITGAKGSFGKAWTLAVLLLSTSQAVWAGPPATPSGTIIKNFAILNYDAPVGAVTDVVTAVEVATSVVTVKVVQHRTSSAVAFLTYAAGAAPTLSGPTQCSSDGGATFAALPDPVSAQGKMLDPATPEPLGPARLYYPGDPVFVQVSDPDQNLDAARRETVLVQVGVPDGKQTRTLRLTETGVDTGVFVGYALTSASKANGCALALKPNQQLELHYTDASDATDQSKSKALVAPLNIVFDSSTGKPVNGARITLVEADSGASAAVIGRDGVSSFPSTVTSGEPASDSSGATYSITKGAYLLPEVKKGRYRLQVEPPDGYRYASSATEKGLQQLPGAPYVLGAASFGEAFRLKKAEPVGFDIPLDPVSTSLYVQKTTSTVTAAVGDMLQFTLTAENTDKTLAARGVYLLDTLPQGFRYVQGSVRLDGARTDEPSISPDGQQLRFKIGKLGPSSRVRVTYVVEVSAATPLGIAINRVQGFGAGGAASNTATAQVQIQNELMQNVNTLIGRVLVGCGDDAGLPHGIGGVRILMENGAYAVTDKNGRYHFEAIKNGTHVVQLDRESLPAGYEVTACEHNTRFAGRGYSQFVELHGGALWHVDFHLRQLPAPSGSVAIQLTQSLDDARVHSTLDLTVDGVGVGRLSATVLPLESLRYVPGSATLNGARLADPQDMGGALVFRLDDRAAGWHGRLQFDLTPVVGKTSTPEWTTRALANFATPAAAHQHTQVVSASLVAGGAETGKPHQAQSAVQQTATRGVTPVAAAVQPAPRATDAPDTKSPADTFKLDPQWLQTATPKPAIIWPAKDWLPAVPSIHVAVKHAPAQHVRLFIDGKLASPRNFLGATRNAAKTVAVSEWLGVPLVEGDNALVAEILQGDRVVERVERNVHYSGEPVRAELAPKQSLLIADGKTKPRLAIRLFDRWGYPARRGTLGRYSVEAPYVPYQSEQDLQKHQLLAVGPREPVYTVGDDGVAVIVLAPTNVSGQATVQVPLQGGTAQQLSAWLKPAARDWVLVGLATDTAAFNRISGHMQTLSGDDPNRDIFQDGRVAFYAKGTIKGQYLLTAAYDTAKKTGTDVNGLQRTVDPNQYFMLYGDASQRGYDASSASKLYLKIERGQFYALFGDFSTGLTVTELSRYERRFNGIKSEYEGQHVKYSAFAARNAQSYVHDEIQGNGTSGLYHLSHQQILLNSEHITIVTRDRYHSERVISSRSLSRYLDYTLDYYTGAIFFKQPVPNRDEHFNPVYIVAEYEVTRPGDQAITAGGRAALKFADGKVEVGATYVNEGTGGGGNKLSGADLRVDFSPTTQLKAEVARTSTGATGAASTLAGNGIPAGSAITSGNDDSRGSAYLITLQHRGEMLENELYLRQQGAGFGLGQQSLGQTGTRKAGGDARYHLNKNWTLAGELYREESLQTDALRNAADASVAYEVNGDSITAGLRHVQDQYLQPTNINSPAPATGNGSTGQVYLGGSIGVFGDQLTLHGTTSQDVGGGTDPAYPESTTVGMDYKLTDTATLFLNEQFAGGNNQQYSRMTEFGVRTSPWERAQIDSSVTQQMTEYGPRTFSTMGLTQGWQATEALTLTAGLSRVATLHQPAIPVVNAATPPAAGTATQDFTSMFFGGTYREKDWSWTSRVETLHSASEHRNGLFGGFYRDLSGGKAFSASLQAFDSRFAQGGDSVSITGRLGFAYRPDDSRWALLDQLDLTYGNRQGVTNSLFTQQGSTGVVASQQSPAQLATAQGTTAVADINQRTWKLVNNLQANYRADDFQWSIYYGSKFARFAFDSGTYQGYTDLVGSEYRYNLSSRWDIGVIVNQLHSWRSNVFSRGFGVETGTNIGKNMWLSVGYNLRGFYDQDFTAAHYTAKGLFIRFRLKFDQDTLREMAEGRF